MGKLSAYIFGMAIALALCFFVLSSYYNPLLNWLMPEYGPPIIFIFTILFLLLANPLKWPIVIVGMVIIGAVIGISSRKGSRAIAATITVYMSLWGFAASALFAILSAMGLLSGNFLSSGSTSGTSPFSVSPVPSGTNISTIMAEPLIGRIAAVLSTFLGSSSFLPASGSPTTTPSPASFTPIIMSFLPYVIINLVILALSAGITGRFIGNIARKKRIAIFKKENNKKTLVLIILLIFIAAAFIPAYNASSPSSGAPNAASYVSFPLSVMEGTMINTSGTQQYIVGGSLVGTQGDLYTIYGNAAPITSSGKNWFNGPSNSATLIVETDNLYPMLHSLSYDMGSNISIPSGISPNFANIIPQGIIVMFFNGSANQTSAMASAELSALKSAGINQTVPIFSTDSIPVAGFGSLYLYSFVSNQYSSENSIANSLNGSISYSGTAEIFNNQLHNGYLVPGYTASSVNSSIFFAGYISGGSLTGDLFRSIGLNISSGTSYVAEGGIFMKTGYAHSSATNHTFNLADMLNFNGNIEFSDSNAQYGIFMGAPENTGGKTSYNTSIITTSTAFSGIVPASTVSVVPSGFTAKTTNYSVNSAYQYPANISVSISTSYLGNNLYRINTTVTNHDPSPISGVSINEKPFYNYYNKTMKITNGSDYFKSSGTLLQNQSLTMSYTVKISNPGVYVISDTTVNYTENGTSYTYYPAQASLTGQNASFISSVNEIWKASASFTATQFGIPYVMDQIYPGIYVFDLLPLLLLILDIGLEYRAFKRWRKNGVDY